MPIHVAITRRILPGKEAEFKAALRRFLGESFLHGGVHGAGMMTALPGGDPREIGILRSFADEAERDAFYESALYKNWEDYAATVTEGVPVHRQLHGLEAWFRTPGAPPPRWKMAIATFLGVYPTSLFLSYALGGVTQDLPLPLRVFIMAACMVGLLTWVVMPFVIKIAGRWLHKPQAQE